MTRNGLVIPPSSYEAEIDRVARMQESYVERVLFNEDEIEMIRHGRLSADQLRRLIKR